MEASHRTTQPQLFVSIFTIFSPHIIIDVIGIFLIFIIIFVITSVLNLIDQTKYKAVSKYIQVHDQLIRQKALYLDVVFT